MRNCYAITCHQTADGSWSAHCMDLRGDDAVAEGKNIETAMVALARKLQRHHTRQLQREAG